MSSTFEILLPVFGLIEAGFLCRRRGVLGPASASDLNRLIGCRAVRRIDGD